MEVNCKDLVVVHRMTKLDDPKRKEIEKRWEKEKRAIYRGISSDKPIPQWVVEKLPGFEDGELKTYVNIAITDQERCIKYLVNTIRYDMVESESEHSGGILTVIEAKRMPFIKGEEYSVHVL